MGEQTFEQDAPVADGSTPVADGLDHGSAPVVDGLDHGSAPVVDGYSSVRPPDPRKGTVITIAGVLVIALVTAGLTVMIGNARSDGASPLDFAGLRAQNTFRMSGSMTVEGASAPISQVEGAVDIDRNLVQMTMTMRFPGDIQGFSMEMIVSREYIYMRVRGGPSGFGPELPEGKTWVKMPVTDELTSLFSQESTMFGPVASDPTRYLETLKQVATSVEEAGTETVRGIPTTIYDFSLDTETILRRLMNRSDQEIAEVLEQTGPTMSARVWVGDDGLPYRQTTEVGSGGESATWTMEMFDYGAAVQITLPSEAETHEMSADELTGREASCTFYSTGQVIVGPGNEQVEPQPSPSMSCSP